MSALLLKDLLSLKEDELDAQAKSFHGLKGTAKKASTDWKSAFPNLGKVYTALEIRLNDGKRTFDDKGNAMQPRYSETMSLTDMIEKATGEKPDNHGLQCKNCFATFVGTKGNGMVTEEVYDRLPSNVVELAGRIAKAAGFALNHEAIKSAATELNAYGKKTVENLKAILEKVAPKDKWETSDAKAHMEKLETEGNLEIFLATCVKENLSLICELVALQTEFIQESVTAKSVFQNLAKASRMLVDAKSDGKNRFSSDEITAWVKEIFPPETDAPENPAESELESALESAHS